MNNLFNPGAWRKTKSQFYIAYLFSVRIWYTFAICFFSWSLRICEPIDFICDPLCLSLFSCLSPAFFLQTYFLSDLCKTHLPFWKIPNEKDPPKHKIIAIFFDLADLINSYSYDISFNFLTSYFFSCILAKICFCLAKRVSWDAKSS